jgi:ribosomal protein S18 acetylase RimI-like enzyme
MLQILELMAFTANLKKVVLTVFVHNFNAVGFFKNLGYALTNLKSVNPSLSF